MISIKAELQQKLFSSINRFFSEPWKENAANGNENDFLICFPEFFVIFIFIFHWFADHENSIKIDSREDAGVDVDDEDLPMGDLDSADHDSNDMSRPRKIRR